MSVRRDRCRPVVCALFLMAAMLSVSATAGVLDTGRVIVKFSQSGGRADAMSRGERLVPAAGLELTFSHAVSGGGSVFRAADLSNRRDAQHIAGLVEGLPGVLYAEPDRRMFPTRIPDDPRFELQWYHAGVPAAMNLPAAWDATTGSKATVVALVDSGLVPHQDIDADILDDRGRVVRGYDFVSEDAPGVFLSANDGTGRDPNPTDPGDWITPAEGFLGGIFAGCPVGASSWHGTHLAGAVGAITNNGTGVAGTDWQARVLPVRVLGKCGGYVSDIMDGLRWAAGLPVPGAPPNPHPASVINLSLGRTGACSRFEQEAIDDVRAAGAVVVVSAGNAGISAAYSSPGNCSGVITVAAVERSGGLAYYSNRGAEVDIAAPGGLMDSDRRNGILSTVNTGLTNPVGSPAGDGYGYLDGTSSAAALVSGVVSLLFAAAPGITAAEVETLLLENAAPFPVGTGASGGDCVVGRCGAGLVDAGRAVAAAAGTIRGVPALGYGGVMLLALLLGLAGAARSRPNGRSTEP